jgi:hypothetical protein
MTSPIPLNGESQMSNATPNPNQSDVPSAQSQADLAEMEALARYLALRTLWSPCWGVCPREAPRRGRP